MTGESHLEMAWIEPELRFEEMSQSDHGVDHVHHGREITIRHAREMVTVQIEDGSAPCQRLSAIFV